MLKVANAQRRKILREFYLRHGLSLERESRLLTIAILTAFVSNGARFPHRKCRGWVFKGSKSCATANATLLRVNVSDWQITSAQRRTLQIRARTSPCGTF